MIFFSIAFLFSSITYAGGSFRLDTELMPILDKNHDLKMVVMNSFDFAESGGANRIGYNVNKILGGKRLGPYHLNAKPKGQEGDYTLTVVFHTEIEFIDQDGKETSNFKKAVEIKESFYSYEVLPIGKSSAYYLGNRF